MKARSGTDAQQLGQDQLADALSTSIAAHVDGVLDAGAVGGALFVWRQRAEADHITPLVGGIDRHDRREGTVAVGDPSLLVFERSWHQVEGGDGVGHFMVVDLTYLLGVAQRRQSQCDRLGPARVHAGRA